MAKKKTKKNQATVAAPASPLPTDTSLENLNYPKPSGENPDKQNYQERKASGIYSQLSQDQIAVLKDTFALIDNDNDGIISDEDLQKAFQMINKKLSPEQQDAMFSRMQDPLTFGGFLSSLAPTLGELSNKNELLDAFKVFRNGSEDEELKCDVVELKTSLEQAGMESADIELAIKSFVKTEMNGTEIFLAERFVNTVRDD